MYVSTPMKMNIFILYNTIYYNAHVKYSMLIIQKPSPVNNNNLLQAISKKNYLLLT